MHCFTTVAFWLAICLPPIPTQDSDVVATVDQKLAMIERGGLATVWEISGDLAELGNEALPRLRERARDDQPAVRLAVSRALLELSDIDTAAESLIELILKLDSDAPSAQRHQLQIEALELLGHRDFEDHTGVVKFLVERLPRALDADEKIAVARSLYEVSAAHALEAKNALRATLDSVDRRIQIAGALALAAIADVDAAKPILSEIQWDPTPEGHLARVYMQKERYYRDNQELRRRLHQERPTLYSTKEGDIGVLDEIIEKIQKLHLRGQEYTGPQGREKLISAAARGMLSFLDPHSTYFTPEANERWTFDLQREYGGIGAFVDTIDKVFTIIRPIYSGPAFKVGLRSGDQIWKVDGWETFGRENEEIIRRLKGPPGTKVVATIFRTGWEKERDVVIERALINVPSVNAELLPGNIGYMEVVQFARNTSDELADAAQKLEARGMESLILDLRNNTGGYLDTAVDIVGQFTGPDKLVVYTEGRMGGDEEWKTRLGVPQRPDYVTTVLINRRSASASEILAGALRDYGRARLVGEHTYGKGSVQNPVPLTSRPFEPFDDRNSDRRWDSGEKFDDLNHNGKWDMGALIKITTARYFLPNRESIHTERDEEGRVIHRGGVDPDVPVKFEGIKAWKEEELAELLANDTFLDYVEAHFDGHEELFRRLAEGDQRNWTQYPDFESFYAGLKTHLSKDDIRIWVRVFVRQKVSDIRKKAFPGFNLFGDYEEDSQLQGAILDNLEQRGIDPATVAEYRAFADKEFEEPEKADVVLESTDTKENDK